jgi:tetratricopeptide (TPR) repeat protein
LGDLIVRLSNQLPNYQITRLPDLRRLLLLVALPLVVYANSFSTGFPLDNRALILEDARVHAATPENVDLILQHTYWWPVGESGLYRPVTTLSYLLNYAVIGNADRPAGYHVLNSGLHVINVLLVFLLVARIANRGSRTADRRGIAHSQRRGDPSGIDNPQSTIQSAIRNPQSAMRTAFAAAAIWAVHPLSTEAVTNIVGRADLLAGLAILSGLLIYATILDTAGGRRILWLVALAATTAIGVFAKESAVVIAPLAVLYAAAFTAPRRTPPDANLRLPRRGRRSTAPVSHEGPKWIAALATVPPLLLLGYQRSIVLGAAPPPEFPFVDNPIAGAPFWSGRLTALAVAGRYLWKTVWPMTLSADYSYAQIPLATGRPTEWAAWIVVAGALLGTMALWRRQRAAFFFAAFAIVTFAPVSNLLFHAGTIMAERVMYLPSVGIIALVVLALDAAARRLHTPAILGAATTVIVLLLAIRTWHRNTDWTSDVTLWSAAVEASPRSFKAHRGLAEALYDSDRAHTNIGAAVSEIEKSIAILAPLPDGLNDARTFRQAGAFYMEQGDTVAAVDRSRAVAMPASRRRAYENAVPMLLRALAIIDAAHGPAVGLRRADALRLLSAVYTRLDEGAKAVDAAVRARELEPANPVSYRQSAAALLIAERPDDAAVALMVGSMVTADKGLREELIALYRDGLDPLGCAVVVTPNGAAINPECATVRRHVCAATADAAAIHQRAGHVDEARRLRESAARQFQCR